MLFLLDLIPYNCFYIVLFKLVCTGCDGNVFPAHKEFGCPMVKCATKKQLMVREEKIRFCHQKKYKFYLIEGGAGGNSFCTNVRSKIITRVPPL